MFFAFDPDQQTIRSWGHFEFEQPCFILTISPIDEPTLRRAAVLSNPYDLKRYLATVDAVVVHNVQLLSPGELNGTGAWCLDNLVELTHLTDPKSSAEGMLYKTEARIDSDVDAAKLAAWDHRVLFTKQIRPLKLFGSEALSPFSSIRDTLEQVLSRASATQIARAEE
ncbi:hypothetical protein [Pseudomonas sp. IT-P176]|uniref:hypothetical protein n=1 Tax=Pseudomonas sp. IT-P176 TaxID=3026444 RepID=UPI0039E045B5